MADRLLPFTVFVFSQFNMSKIGLFFGSFNPIHIGHLIIANSMLQHSDLEAVWIVVSPQNPLKERGSLLNDAERLKMVQLAIADNEQLKTSDIEFRLPLPSYTIHTLQALTEEYPTHEFCLLMGSDNLANFTRWKDWESILTNYKLYVYPRPGTEHCELASHPHVTMVPVPMLDISSTYIREQIAEGKDVRYLVPQEAYEYLIKNQFYKQKQQLPWK